MKYKINNSGIDNQLVRKATAFKIKQLIIGLFIISSIFDNSIIAIAQVVKHPVSEITTTISRYSYPYILSQTQKKDIEYIIVQAPNGEIKTCFNACDVCYKAHKGYSQTGTDLKCNNCGNKFKIDELGISNKPGSCNPGFLPNKIEGDSIIINVSDLIKGEYFYVVSTISDVNDELLYEIEEQFQIYENNDYLRINSKNDNNRCFIITSINGQPIKKIINSSFETFLLTSEIPSGLYILTIQEGTQVFHKLFLKIK